MTAYPLNSPVRKRPHGDGTAYYLPSGKHRRQVMVNGRRVTATGMTPRESQENLDIKLARLRDARPLVDSGGLVRDYFETWKDTTAQLMIPASSTRDLYVRYLRSRVLPALGPMRIRDVRPQDCERVLVACTAELSDSTCRTIYAAMSALFRSMVRDELVARSPLTGVKRPQIQDQTEATSLSAAELDALLYATVNDTHAVLWQLLATTGLRRGEALGLRWSDLDVATGRLRIQRQAVRTDSEGLHVKEILKGKQNRTVHPSSSMLVALHRHHVLVAREFQMRFELGMTTGDAAWMFPNELGGLLEPRNVSRRFTRLAVNAIGRDVGPHVLRHTYATGLLDRGTPVESVSRMLGHASSTITNEVYAHAVPASEQAAAEAFGERVLGILGATQNIGRG